MLTALYELKNVRRSRITTKNLTLGAGVSSTLVGLSGVPLGGSAEFGLKNKIEGDDFVSDPLVYAARYQLLKTSYLRADERSKPLAISLHPDNIYCQGFAMGGTDENWRSASQAAEVVPKDPDFDEFVEPTEEEMEYWEEFDIAQERLLRDLDE